MGIDFHSDENRHTYTTREADSSWKSTIEELVPIERVSAVADIGCGGGIYSKALADMGAGSVLGIDFSEAMLDGARENCKDYDNVSFVKGDALHTGLEENRFDLVLSRALIHHLNDLPACFTEAFRILQEDGVYIVQDRTPGDCTLSGDNHHIRGYFFELFPKLIEKETARRYTDHFVTETLQAAGFRDIERVKLWETRQVYESKDQLLKDISKRTGRSILHELDDSELQSLLDYIDQSVTSDRNLIEKDKWTIWKAVK